MKKYNFDYSDQIYALKLFGLCFISFIVLISIAVLTNNILGTFGNLTICISIPIIIFLLNKKNIRRNGFAIINDSSVDFELNGKTTTMNYSDINNYLIQIYNGTLLEIKLKDDNKFKLFANSNFCDAEEFYIFCHDLELAIQHYKNTYQIEITRKKSFFEKKWILPFLIIITSIFMILIIWALYIGVALKATSLFLSLGSLMSLWAGYLSSKKIDNK